MLHSTVVIRIWNVVDPDLLKSHCCGSHTSSSERVISKIADAGSSLADVSTLKMEAICSAESSVHTRSTRRRIPEDDIHALSGIRIHDLGFRASEDSTCLRPLGYRDQRLYSYASLIIMSTPYIITLLYMIHLEIYYVLNYV
jgi:hypothetical protein